MSEKLKELLLEIELSLKNEDWDRALFLYEEIEKNWDLYVQFLDMEKAKVALELLYFIDALLKEKLKSLKEEKDYLSARKNYSKFF